MPVENVHLWVSKQGLVYAVVAAIETRLKDRLARMGIDATATMDYSAGGLPYLVVGKSKYYGEQRILEVAASLVTERKYRLEDMADELRANDWTVTRRS